MPPPTMPFPRPATVCSTSESRTKRERERESACNRESERKQERGSEGEPVKGGGKRAYEEAQKTQDILAFACAD